MTSDNRSVTARDISGSVVTTGNNNTTYATISVRSMPPPEAVHPGTEVAELRALLATLNAPERGKLDRAVQDAEEESSKAAPDKEELAGALGRIGKCAKAADNFSEHVEKIAPRVAALASWLGPLGKVVLAAFGIAAG